MTPDFYTNNRAELMNKIDGIAVLSGYTGMQLSGDMAAPFLQESNFLYLSGIKDPDWLLIISKEKSWLVAPDVSEVNRIFDGGLTNDCAISTSGVDAVVSYEEGYALIANFVSRDISVYSLGDDPYSVHYNFSLNPAPKMLQKRLDKIGGKMGNLRRPLSELRAVKKQEEIKAIDVAVNITIDAFSSVRDNLLSFSYEYEIEAEFTHLFRRKNGSHAYDPIVAGGLNACTLHYNINADSLEKGSLVLLDVGARLDGYAADVTRTYSFGDPSQRQKDIHSALTIAQHEIITLLNPGLSFAEYHEKVDEIMHRTLKLLGLLAEKGDYRKYFPHAISHGLGMDVHDTLGGHKEFLPGMVLTVEPGIYIPAEKTGIRLEDNILITETGRKNLSESLSLGL